MSRRRMYEDGGRSVVEQWQADKVRSGYIDPKKKKRTPDESADRLDGTILAGDGVISCEYCEYYVEQYYQQYCHCLFCLYCRGTVWLSFCSIQLSTSIHICMCEVVYLYVSVCTPQSMYGVQMCPNQASVSAGSGMPHLLIGIGRGADSSCHCYQERAVYCQGHGIVTIQNTEQIDSDREWIRAE